MNLENMDAKLSEKFGSYASYRTADDPVKINYHGDDPAESVDRLLDAHCSKDAVILDLGCGAGFTLCRLAPQVKQIWGFDQESELIEAAQLRADQLGLDNIKFLLGNIVEDDDTDKLPDNNFNLVFSRRGPNVSRALMAKLKPDAHVVQELYQDPVGLKRIFGRKPTLPVYPVGSYWLVDKYEELGLVPVSIRDIYYESFFRDILHLEAYLSHGNLLNQWWMNPLPYDPVRDREALEMYTRYNTTDQGIRLVNHRVVYLFRREDIVYYPAEPEERPLYW